MLAMCDEEGNQHLLLQHITDHKKDDTALKGDDAFFYVRGRRCQKKTTKGWKLCVEWKDSEIVDVPQGSAGPNVSLPSLVCDW